MTIKQLIAAATKLPWRMFGDGSIRRPGGLFSEEEPPVNGVFVCRPDEWEDAELIVALVNSASALVGLVEAVRELHELKMIKIRMENGSANRHETLRYTQEKEMAWTRLRKALAALPAEWTKEG